MNFFEDIRTQFILRARMHDDEAAIVLKGHLLTEYLLNRIVKVKISKSKKYKETTFSKKVSLLNSRSMLNPTIYGNIRLLNSFRNRLAHDLEATISKDEMLFYKSGKGVIKIQPKKGGYPVRYYLRLLCNGVLTQIINHMLLKLGVDPMWKGTMYPI